MYKLVFFVPDGALDEVKQALFSAGAGTLGAYSQCCWQVRGEGQFFAEAESNPSYGEPMSLTKVSEYRVEMVLEDAVLDACIAALKLAHPYEVPAYHVIRLEQWG